MSQKIQQWCVGGCVRDVLLNLVPKDIDYCWTGATPDDMKSFGFVRVGAAFPVYLDENGNEHALARQERKTGSGYLGFECNFDTSITIEDDLVRRDLTINSMAVRIEDWEEFVATKCLTLVVDPFGGYLDLCSHWIRHTSDAFADDPVRVLRAARFSARYNFDVHSSTMVLMMKIVPELFAVPQERIWAEFAKGLMEEYPVNMFIVLRDCKALVHSGPLHAYRGVDLATLSRIEKRHDLCVRFALVSFAFTPLDYDTRRIPNDCALVGNAFNRCYTAILNYCWLPAEQRLQLLEHLRSLNNDRWLLDECLELLTLKVRPASDAVDIITAINTQLHQVRSIDAATIAASCKNGAEIKQKIFDARIAALSE